MQGTIEQRLLAHEGKCPVCSEPARGGCRCLRGDSYCKNDHHWHWCVKHSFVLVIGRADHKKDGCSCGDPVEAPTRIYLPHEQADRYQVGDIFTFQHGPRLPNVFAFRVTSVNEWGQFTAAKMLDKAEYAILEPMFEKWAAEETQRNKPDPVVEDYINLM